MLPPLSVGGAETKFRSSQATYLQVTLDFMPTRIVSAGLGPSTRICKNPSLGLTLNYIRLGRACELSESGQTAAIVNAP